jgi:hypothetical protein
MALAQPVKIICVSLLLFDMQSLKSNELVKIKKPVIPRLLSLNITG